MSDSELLFQPQEIQWKECATTWLQEITKGYINWGILQIACVNFHMVFWPYCLLVCLGTLGCSSSVIGVCQPTHNLTLGGMGSIFEADRCIGCLPFRVREIIVFLFGAVTEISDLVLILFQNFYALNRLPHKGVVSSSYFTFHLFSLPPSSVPLLRALPVEDGTSLFWKF